MKSKAILAASLPIVASALLLASGGMAKAGLIGFYNFDGTTNDVSGSNHNPVAGTISGYTAGFEGQAGIFNGASNRLQLPIDVSPSVMPALTMGAWVSAIATTGRRAILSADDALPGDYDRQIGIDNRVGGATTGTYAYSAFAGSNTGVISSGQAVVPVWTFVAARYVGTSVTLFVNGQSFSGSDTNADPVQFSQLWIGKNPSFDSYFSGYIDNAFVFDQALTDADVSSIQTGGESAILALAAVPEPATVAVGLLCLGVGLVRRRRNSVAK